jgi:integrase/recombinase XerD
MAQPSLYVREKIEGKWKHVKIEEGRGRKTGDLEPPFFVRPFVNGKQTWRKLDAETFKAAKDEVATVVSPAIQEVKNRVTIQSAIEVYLYQKRSKAKKTLAQYRTAFAGLTDSLKGTQTQYLDQITENTLRGYKRWMEDKGYAGKTIDTRMNIVFFLLKKNGVVARLPKDEMPTVEEEPAVPYTDDDIEKLLEAMDEEEKIRYKFFLATGSRDKEVTYASWPDIDWTKSEYHVRSKPDVGFTVKSHESRTVPIPDSLLAMLKKRRKSAEHDRWIFVNEEGRPDNHFLRKLKRIAFRAGLNCGHCKTTITKGKYHTKRGVEVTCKTDPVCEHIYLHRLRKTCATRWQENGIPIRTIQAWLGHKNLETTMIYLGVTDSSKLRSQINQAFGD